MATVIPVNQGALEKRSGQATPSYRDEAQTHLNRVVVILFAEECRHSGSDGVEGTEDETRSTSDDSHFFLTGDTNRIQEVWHLEWRLGCRVCACILVAVSPQM